MKELGKKESDWSSLDGEALPEVLKIPCVVTGCAWKKMASEWEVTISVQQENLRYLQPLQEHIGEHFILCLVRAKSGQDIEDFMHESLDAIDITPFEDQ